jgi:hypothetical protein
MSARQLPVRDELAPPQYLLHRCAQPGCDAFAFGARCERHETPEDRERLAAMDAAILRAAEAEERWLAAREAALRAEQAAGVRRSGPSAEAGAR